MTNIFIVPIFFDERAFSLRNISTQVSFLKQPHQLSKILPLALQEKLNNHLLILTEGANFKAYLC